MPYFLGHPVYIWSWYHWALDHRIDFLIYWCRCREFSDVHCSTPWHRNEFESEWGHQSGVRNFFWSCPSTILALKIQLVVLDSTFVMVSIVWSVSRLLFYSQCSLCPIESAPLAEHNAVPDTCEFSYSNSCVFAQLVFWPTEARWGR